MIDRRSRIVFIGGLVCLLVAVFTAEVRGQAISNPNQIRGRIEFDNANPAILEILSPSSGTGRGFSHGLVYATSVGVTPPLDNNSYVTPDGALSAPYEITVEAGLPGEGIPYQVWARMYMDTPGGYCYYDFAQVLSAPVEEEPAPDIDVNLRECAGLLDIRWLDHDGNPIAISGGTVNARRESAPGSGSYELQSRRWKIPDGTIREYLPVRGDGSRYRVIVQYELGTDPYSDMIRWHEAFLVEVPCDTIVDITCVVPSSGDLGRIVGAADMLREDEHNVEHYSWIFAYNGPDNNQRQDTIAGSPSSGLFELENLPPSDTVFPPRGYSIYARMVFRLGRRFELFSTPIVYGGARQGILVGAGETVDLGDMFVLDPGYVTGDVLLAGPASGSCLSAIRRHSDYDSNGDGIPNSTWIAGYSSHVGASGIALPAAGATRTTDGGWATVLFAGEFNPATDCFEGDYEFVLAALHGESGMWNVNELGLRFLDRTDPGDPDSYQDSYIEIFDQLVPVLEIAPETTTEVPFRYCVSKVILGFHSKTGTFYDPHVLSSPGSFEGTDFEDEAADYTVDIVSAYGTPTALAEASDEGRVVMVLPQGSYTLTPFVTSVNPGGGTSETELPPVDVEVGCRQIITLVPELQVAIDPVSEATSAPTLDLTGFVTGTAGVEEITYTVNDGPPVIVCTDCGANPPVSVEVMLEDCDNEITVTARDELDNTASVTVFCQFDDTPPDLACPDDYYLKADPETGTVPADAVDIPAEAPDNCAGTVPVSNDAPEVFPEGTTVVTLTAIDLAGNQATCSFSVTVVRAVSVDIKPGSCPNPILTGKRGVTSIAVLGTVAFDVTAIEPQTARMRLGSLESSPPLRWSIEDVGTPMAEGAEPCECHVLNGDGHPDLVFKFDMPDLVETLALDLLPAWSYVPLTLRASLRETSFVVEGSDCIRVQTRGDMNGDGTFDLADVVTLLMALFGGRGAGELTAETADVNGDGALDLADAIALLDDLM